MADEFDIIHRHFAPLSRGNPAALGLRDDAAVLAVRNGHEHVVTTDAIVAGVHFLENESPENIAARLCASNLSDLAAMGAIPVGFTLAAAWTKNTNEDFIAAFARGLGFWVDEYGFPLLGGDTVSTPGPMMFSLTAIGEVKAGKSLKRSGAVPGDRVYVSGTIGDGALGLLAAQDKLPDIGKEHIDYLKRRFQHPTPRISTGQAISDLASACIDISDGLVQDIGHICETSGVSVRIDASSIPLSAAAKAALEADANLMEAILSGGDDYELAFTAPSAPPPSDVPLTMIGSVKEGNQGVQVIGKDGITMKIDRGGFNHFSNE